MQRKNNIGAKGERLARQYLEKKGYTHIASNWRCKAGELDLIMWAPKASKNHPPVGVAKSKKFDLRRWLRGGDQSADQVKSQTSNVKDRTLVIIEVRLRRPITYGHADETVTWQKQQKIIRATQWYQQAVNYWGNIRFDVIRIEVKEDSQLEIQHIPNSFTA